MPSMIRSFQSLIAALAASTLLAGAAFAAPVFSVAGPATVASGSAFTLDVVASDVTDLYGFQFDVRFDPTRFQAQGTSEGGFLLGGGSTFFDGGTIDNVLGSISFVLDTLMGLGAGVDGSGVLASVAFTSVGSGVGVFELQNVLALDSALGEIAVGTASLNVNAVPEPAMLGLMLAAFGGLALAQRRRRALG